MAFRGRAGRSVVPPTPKNAPKPRNRNSDADKLIGQLTRVREPQPEVVVTDVTDPDLAKS